MSDSEWLRGIVESGWNGEIFGHGVKGMFARAADAIEERDRLKARVAELEGEVEHLKSDLVSRGHELDRVTAELEDQVGKPMRLALAAVEAAEDRIAELEATVAAFLPGGICSYCGHATDSLSANPSKWPMVFPDTGSNKKPVPHHVGCVMDRMESRPDPPAPAAIDPDMPRRFRYLSSSSGCVVSGVYDPSAEIWSAVNGSVGNGLPLLRCFEWIDPAPPAAKEGERGDRNP
jgi:hypothetical protein